MINQTPFMLTRCGRDLRCQFVSQTYAEMMGRQPADMAGKAIVEIMLGRHVPVAAVTAYAHAEDRERAIAAGFDEYLATPVDPAALAFAVATLRR